MWSTHFTQWSRPISDCQAGRLNAYPTYLNHLTTLTSHLISSTYTAAMSAVPMTPVSHTMTPSFSISGEGVLSGKTAQPARPAKPIRKVSINDACPVISITPATLPPSPPMTPVRAVGTGAHQQPGHEADDSDDEATEMENREQLGGCCIPRPRVSYDEIATVSTGDGDAIDQREQLAGCQVRGCTADNAQQSACSHDQSCVGKSAGSVPIPTAPSAPRVAQWGDTHSLHSPLRRHLTFLHPNTPEHIVAFVATRLLSRERPHGFSSEDELAYGGEWQPVWAGCGDIATAGVGNEAAKGCQRIDGEGKERDERLEWMYGVARRSYALLEMKAPGVDKI